MNRITRLLLLCVFALVGTSAGPVGAASPYGWVRPDGRPVVWNNSQPISYSVDQGPLGRLSNADAAALVQTAFQRWRDVNTASISFCVRSLTGPACGWPRYSSSLRTSIPSAKR